MQIGKTEGWEARSGEKWEVVRAEAKLSVPPLSKRKPALVDNSFR